MHKINEHPILDIKPAKKAVFEYEGKEVIGEKGFTIAAALHQAGYPVHSHSLKNRNRSLECGIGKCGACEMLVDGQIKRICITKVENVRQVNEIPRDYKPVTNIYRKEKPTKIFRTEVAIIGAGPAGLAAREQLRKHNISNIVIDNNDQIGGQFLMQTHQFFFFEKEKQFGGMRGFDIAKTLAGRDHEAIFLNSTVWDILQGRRLAVKNIQTDEVYYVDVKYLIVATGAVPFMPPFENDDLPGVYTAAVVQKMMNTEFTLLGHNVLTVGAGNIGYLTSYQLVQAGANVKAILEAQSHEGGFPVQANRIRRLGIPVILSHMLLEAIPNEKKDGIIGVVIARCENFKPVPGTEQRIYGIDAINICTGLVPDDQLLTKGCEVFGRDCYGAGDAIRIGEGTTAVLRGKQVAYEILESMNIEYDYDSYLAVSKEYIDSQQHPIRVLNEPFLPSKDRMKKPFVLIDCLYGFACNPCEFACPHGAIKKSSTSSVPFIDFDKCTGCLECIHQCPGLAIFGYNPAKDMLFMPVEYEVPARAEVYLVDNDGNKLGSGVIEKILKKPNKTDVVRVKAHDLHGEDLLNARGFIVKEEYPEKIEFAPHDQIIESEGYICHCDDVTLPEVLNVIGGRKFISIDEVKHTTRLGMGACRGKRCIARLKQTLSGMGISIVGEPTPRAPLSNQLSLGELYPTNMHERVITKINGKSYNVVKTEIFIAGGGIAGSALFRYFAQAGKKPVLVNAGRGASWRNIAGGRPNFSVPELSEIAVQNHQIFKQLQKTKDIDYMPTQYCTFAHDEQMYKALEESKAFSDAFMIEPKDFKKFVTPYINPDLKNYIAALITKNCWQAAPGKVVDLIRTIGIENGGRVLEDCELIDVEKDGDIYKILLQDHNKKYIAFHAPHFINALGENGHKFAKRLGIETPLYSVKHQAFITRRLPMMGIDAAPLPMMIDRRLFKGFSAVYGQQLAETGQVIGCASPAVDPRQTNRNLSVNVREFLEIVSETFVNWIPDLSSVGFQAVWAGYYIEPKMIIDPQLGLFIGLRGQGYMLGQYLAKLYVDKALGKTTPPYFDRLKLTGDGLLEKALR
jgi:glycine/D-amino acid oxidase-like deaminating enzyme/Fe-S-cluster-containing hydrogenase component 2